MGTLKQKSRFAYNFKQCEMFSEYSIPCRANGSCGGSSFKCSSIICTTKDSPLIFQSSFPIKRIVDKYAICINSTDGLK